MKILVSLLVVAFVVLNCEGKRDAPKPRIAKTKKARHVINEAVINAAQLKSTKTGAGAPIEAQVNLIDEENRADAVVNGAALAQNHQLNLARGADAGNVRGSIDEAMNGAANWDAHNVSSSGADSAMKIQYDQLNRINARELMDRAIEGAAYLKTINAVYPSVDNATKVQAKQLISSLEDNIKQARALIGGNASNASNATSNNVNASSVINVQNLNFTENGTFTVIIAVMNDPNAKPKNKNTSAYANEWIRGAANLDNANIDSLVIKALMEQLNFIKENTTVVPTNGIKKIPLSAPFEYLYSIPVISRQGNEWAAIEPRSLAGSELEEDSFALPSPADQSLAEISQYSIPVVPRGEDDRDVLEPQWSAGNILIN